MNKKLTKLLSVFLIAGLIGTGTAVGVAGCKKNKPSTPSNNNQTEQNITWNMKGHGTKPSDAAEQTSGGKVTQPTAPSDDDYDFGGWYKDSACTEEFDFNETFTSAVTVYAKWTAKTSQGGDDTGDDSGDDKGESIKIVKEFKAEDFDAATENDSKKWLEKDSEIVDGVSVAGSDIELQVQSGGKNIYYNGENKKMDYRVKFSNDLFTNKGEGTEAYKELKQGIKVEVEKDATLLVYGTSGSGNKTAYFTLAEGVTEGEGTEAVTKLTVVDTQQICWKNSDVNAVIFELKAGKTYYVGSDTITANDTNAANAVIYYIEINSAFDEGKGEKVDAKTATCETKGNVAHYYTRYGRYLDETGEDVLNPNEVFSAELGHKWTYTTVTTPDATNAGSVALTCGRDGTHTKTVTLPALKANIYTRTPITDGDDAGKCTYSIKVEGVYNGNEKVDVVTFVAEKVEESKVDYVDISNIVYDKGPNAVYVMSASSEPEQVGDDLYITAGTNNGGAMSNGGTLNVEFYAGSISMDDTESANILYGVLGFGEAKTEGSYRVSGKLNPTAASSWDPVQIVTSTDISSDQDEKILFALSASGSKKYCMRFGKTRREESAYDVKDNSSYYFRLDVDLDNHVATVSLSPDGTQWIEIDSVTDESINTFAGVRFQTGSGSRSFSVEEIMISQSMEVDPVVGEYAGIERVYELGQSSFVLSNNNVINIKGNKTFSIGQINGTWDKVENKDYYSCTFMMPSMEGGQPQETTYYVVLSEEDKAVYLYGSEDDIEDGTFMEAYLLKGEEVSSALAEKLNAAHYGEVEEGERYNPIVIAELSETAITKTAEADTDVYYVYKNTGDAVVTITVVPTDTRINKVTISGNDWHYAAINGPFQVGAGETVIITASAEDGNISFVFRAYDPATDGAVKYDITLNTRGVVVDCPAKLETNDEGKLGSNLPTLQNTASAEFLGWELEDGTEVTADTVFSGSVTIYARWNITAVTFATQNNTFDYSKITPVADNAKLSETAFLGTSNAYMTIVDDGTSQVNYRTSNDCVEVINGGIKVYFGAAGSLTLEVTSNGGSNDSLIGLKNEDDEYIASKTTGLTAATDGASVSGNKTLSSVAVGSYIIHGQTKVTVAFDITEAGWYTIYSDKTETGRGIRVMAVTQIVNAYDVPQSEFTATNVEVPATLTISEQESETITPDITTNDGVYIKEINWSSEDDTVATVEKGVITVLKKGAGNTVEITCAVTDSFNNTVTKKITVTVNHVAATGVSITTAADSTLKVGDTKQLEYAATVDGEGTATDVAKAEWDSSNKTVATVDEDGLVTVIGAGSTNITVKITTLTDAEFTSEAYAITIASITATGISVEDAEVAVGKTVDLEVTVTPAGASGYTVEYASGDPTVATVDNSGKVTGVAAGNATITATLKVNGEVVGEPATCTVKVAVKDELTCGSDEMTSSNAAFTKDGSLISIASVSGTTARNRAKTLAYEGTDYYAWQFQQTATDILTVTAKDKKVTVTIGYCGFNDKGEAKSNQIKYKVGDGEYTEAAAHNSDLKIETLTVTLNASEVLTIYTINGSNKLGIFFVLAEEADE